MEIDHPAPLDDYDDILNNCQPVEIPPAPEPVQAVDASGPRLIITQIVTENFKSYGGRRILGPFNKNFNCIIGPNGSGKSNVIDSMLFVFGYRASKVRSKKLSQLIHQSEAIPNVDSCMVAVHFQKIIDNGCGPTDFEFVPDTSFVVSRKAYRDNTSAYWIDNSRVVYRDLATMLRRHGVDLDHNRFLILQGEVEQIALMKPKAPSEHEDGFLEYLEDIIGSSRFKEPLTILNDRIERLNDVRIEKLTRVKAVEREKDELEDIRNEAVDYLRLVNQVTRMKNIIFQQNLASERVVEADTKEKLKSIQEECQQLNASIKEKIKERTQTETERDKAIESHCELLNKHRDAKAKFSEHEAEDSRLRDEYAHVKSAGRRLSKTLQAERNKLEEMERLPQETEAKRDVIVKQLAELDEIKKKHEATYQEMVDSLEIETAPLRAKVESVEKTLAPLQAEADELSSKLALEKQQYNLLMAGQRREQERVDRARGGAKTAQEKLQTCEKELTDSQTKLSTSQRRQSTSGQGSNLIVALNAATKDLEEVRSREAVLTKELNEMRTKLVESKSTLQADTSRGRVLNALLEAKRSGALPGILGRLGDLAAIPPRYDIAVSTACGALDNIVTDSMDTAQKAVTFLKQQNLGLATFIGLDKMQKWQDKCRAPFTAPRGEFSAERLFDLVETVDNSIRPALYFALRDTLVTDTMDSAVKIGYNQRQRHRVVTLQGQLIEISGAMSGGGGRPSSGRMLTSLKQVQERRNATEAGSALGSGSRKSMDQSAQSSNLVTLEQKLTKGDAELSHLRSNRSRLEEVVTRLSNQRDEAGRTVRRCEAECVRLRADIKALTEEADQAQGRLKSIGPSAQEQQQFQTKLTKLEKTVKQKNDEATKKRQEAETFKAELLDVGSARLTTVRSRLDAIEKKAKETNDQLTKLEVSVKTSVKNHQKTLAKIASLETELEIAKKKLEEVDTKLKEVEIGARACMDSVQEMQSQVESIRLAKEEAETKIVAIESQLSAIQKSEVAARRLISQLEGELTQATGKARQWQRDIRALRLHRLDDEDEVEESVVQKDQTIGSPESTQQSSQIIHKLPKKSYLELPQYSGDDLKDLTVDGQEMQSLEERISSMAPNMAAIEEYRRKADIYLTRVGELNHVTSVLGEQRKSMDEAKSKRLSEFLDGFHMITAKLKEMYQMITQGGDAELELIDSLDPFSEGIVFSVRPPKKSWKNIANLSGGEKTLSSLALVFALHHYKPTPLYVMDEIDAALDFKNVSIVGNYLKERTRNAQFIVISLRNNMFELADRLVGIYKTRNVTKTVTLDPNPLTEQLRSTVVRVATAHGREKEVTEKPLKAHHPPAPPASYGVVQDSQPM